MSIGERGAKWFCIKYGAFRWRKKLSKISKRAWILMEITANEQVCPLHQCIKL